MAELNREVTLSFKEDVNAFTSFKSYVPDWGLSLNNRYYTFKNGSPWEHNIETDESITEKGFSTVINADYQETKVNGNIVFNSGNDAIDLNLYNNDTVILDLFDETRGVLHTDRRAEYTLVDGKGIFSILSNIDGNYEDIVGSTSSTYNILRVQLLNFNVIPRNTFYNDGSAESVVEFIINNDPSVIKQFKTIGYEGIGIWEFKVYTDVESNVINEDDIPKVYDPNTLAGVVTKDDIVKREGKFFANINGTEKDVTNLDFSSISVQGIGVGSPTGLSNQSMIELNSEFGKDVRVGYGLYFFDNLAIQGQDPNYSDVIKYAGTIESIDGRVITYDKGATGIDPGVNDFFLYAQNNIIEKSGAIGAYAHIRMTNDDVEHAEVFTVNSEVVPSSR